MPEIPNSRIRKLRTWAPGKRSSELIGEDEKKNQITLIDLASNDYLDLARHPLFCLLYTSPSPRDATLSRMPSSA